MAVSVIPNVWETTNQSTKWTHGKRYNLSNDVPADLPHPAVTWVIGIRLADMFPPGTVDIAALVPVGCDYRVIGPHRGGQVRRRDVHRITLLWSPQPATEAKQRQVQQLNYDTFVGVMADMVKKYAPRILM